MFCGAQDPDHILKRHLETYFFVKIRIRVLPEKHFLFFLCQRYHKVSGSRFAIHLDVHIADVLDVVGNGELGVSDLHQLIVVDDFQTIHIGHEVRHYLVFQKEGKLIDDVGSRGGKIELVSLVKSSGSQKVARGGLPVFVHCADSAG